MNRAMKKVLQCGPCVMKERVVCYIICRTRSNLLGVPYGAGYVSE